MSGQASILRQPPSSDMVHDPVFQLGYGEIFRGRGQDVPQRWSLAEQRAYDRGRGFGSFVLKSEGQRIRLTTRAGTIAPDCLELLSIFLRGLP